MKNKNIPFTGIDIIDDIKNNGTINYYSLNIVDDVEKSIVREKYLYGLTNLIYLDVDEVINLNSRAQEIFVEKGTYGVEGVSDLNHVRYTLDMVKDSISFGSDQLPTIATKAAYLWHKIAKFQAFKNGNKRTAMLSTLVFLHSNGYDFQYKNGLKKELIDMSQRIAQYSESDDSAIKFIRNYILKNIKLNINNEEWDMLEKLGNSKVE
ncbi:type II toxin-antitoxin system death-on-curing family toxin [Companilactobacillus nodensis]|uniref:Fido domain-containing protein n=1 Tax=Companilactobacillus nodensis DSM 19682 = JCM 14932 = NBRC 107160 TaxID=1423775 RepID=A0A0R1K7E4_9LACO|nr:type II toxin-antitoxin system death-on-curing family toxin [Companilactobacillus nodensis]KRK79243.1 hypothetical protein FD03_GL001609 [Companilactobacillus nodensis DSM 19682 = JCM 14932 = NBRC 107160]